MSEGRYELKYALPASRREELLQAATAWVRPDPHALSLATALPGLALPDGEPPRGYVVHSLYFDTPTLDGYARRLARDRVRNRMRVRTYGLPGDDAPVFLEAKRKLARQVIKHRVRVGTTRTWAAGDPLQPWVSAVDLLAEPEASAGRRWLEILRHEGLIPVASTHYVREIYVHGRDRLSIDHRVRAQVRPDPLDFQREGDLPLIPEDWLIVELKFTGAEPLWMRQLVARLRLRSEPISKFALGVAHGHRADRPGELRNLVPPSVLRATLGPTPSSSDVKAAK